MPFCTTRSASTIVANVSPPNVCDPLANAPPMASVAPPFGENDPGISSSGSLNCTLLMPSLSPFEIPLLVVVVPPYCTTTFDPVSFVHAASPRCTAVTPPLTAPGCVP